MLHIIVFDKNGPKYASKYDTKLPKNSNFGDFDHKFEKI